MAFDDLTHLLIAVGVGEDAATATAHCGLRSVVGNIAQLVVSLGAMVASDKLLEQAFAAASIKFPSALFAMFFVFALLLLLHALAPALANGFMAFFHPATLFIHRLPSGVKKVLHPIICCALSADLAAVAYGYLSRSGVDAVLGDYLTKAPSNPGAGDILMGFLGSVIISFAFSMFKQRKLVKRHAAEIFTSIAVASTFSLYSTAILGRVVELEPILTVSILPRCITVALALSIVSFFEGANTSVTAAVVVLTGLIGANFAQAVMDKLRLKDPIARGIGTASSAHGLGTAAVSAKEPEALPFCAIAYGLTGVVASLICYVPTIRQSLVFIAGAGAGSA